MLVYINSLMKQDAFGTDLQPGNELDPYQNGQSDAEKLMRRHLQTPGDVITEEDLRNLKTGTAAEDSESVKDTEPLPPLDETKDAEEENSGEKQTNSWDVLSS